MSETTKTKKYDFEYNTQFKKEYYYLKDQGIRPITSIKDDNDVITFKYRRSPRLFRAVADFYEKYENEKMFENLSKIAEAVKKSVAGEENPFEGIMGLNPEVINKLFVPKPQE